VASKILPEAIRQLEALGAHRSDLLVAFGPAISGQHYQVGDDVVDAISNSLEADPSDGVASDGVAPPGLLQTMQVLLPDDQPGRHRLDIRGAAALQLQQHGLDSNQISDCPLCTLSEPNLFHSWRRDQVKAVQWSGIVAQAPATI
jgi:copper oxidase (laccase) domain-containing protein